jgi:hypothetical protein
MQYPSIFNNRFESGINKHQGLMYTNNLYNNINQQGVQNYKECIWKLHSDGLRLSIHYFEYIQVTKHQHNRHLHSRTVNYIWRNSASLPSSLSVDLLTEKVLRMDKIFCTVIYHQCYWTITLVNALLFSFT